MENIKLNLENIKCGGCASFIQGKLKKDYHIDEAKVDYEKGTVEFPLSDHHDLKEIIVTLSKMGYPEIGEGNSLKTAKSYVSCMIGRVNNNK